MAAETRRFDRFEFLLGLGADPAIVSWLPLRMACAAGADAWVERLLERAAPSPAGLDLALCGAVREELDGVDLAGPSGAARGQCARGGSPRARREYPLAQALSWRDTIVA